MARAPTPVLVRYLSSARVCDKFSRSKTWLYRTLDEDPTFPKPKRLGASPVWIEQDLEDWMALQSSLYVPPKVPRKPGRQVQP